MAGNNQHFIPQFLQRGFASHKQGKTAYTWEFRSNGNPLNEPIKDVGAEWQFYTEPNDTIVDDKITHAENQFGNLANRLKACQAGPVSEPTIPQFIAHLEVRTRHLRRAFLDSSNYIATRLLNLIADTDTFVSLIQRRMANDSQWLRSLFIEEIKKQTNLPRDLNAHVNKCMKSAGTMIPILLELQKPAIAEAVALLKVQLPSRFEKAIKSGHLRALKQPINPEARSDQFMSLHFRVIETSGVNLILGDSAVLFRIDDSRPFRPYTEKNNKVRAVFLPLTPNRLLIGEQETTDWDCMAIKRQAARCSLEYFIAHENTPENNNLKNEIGTDAALLTEAELEDLALESFRQIEKPKGNSPD